MRYVLSACSQNRSSVVRFENHERNSANKNYEQLFFNFRNRRFKSKLRNVFYAISIVSCTWRTQKVVTGKAKTAEGIPTVFLLNFLMNLSKFYP